MVQFVPLYMRCCTAALLIATWVDSIRSCLVLAQGLSFSASRLSNPFARVRVATICCVGKKRTNGIGAHSRTSPIDCNSAHLLPPKMHAPYDPFAWLYANYW